MYKKKDNVITAISNVFVLMVELGCVSFLMAGGLVNIGLLGN